MINGNTLRDAIISGANNIVNHRHAVDELNVFPVPDGDTGTNMSMTISAGARELKRLENATVSEVASVAASAFLRGARGNSGVILSLLFRGFSKGLAGLSAADGKDFANALSLGVSAAYKAVMKPTEGTILTVARVAAERAVEACTAETDPVKIWQVIVSEAKATLETTPELLPVLKKAGVVDAGGMGLVIIFEGMLAVFEDGKMIAETEDGSAKPVDAFISQKNAAGADLHEEITFTYCTEFIVHKTSLDANGLRLRAYLETVGDSVVVVDDDDIIKVHVHTNNPGNAMQEGLAYGSLHSMKIENMREQHENRVAEAQVAHEVEGVVPVDPDTEFGFVAVSAGEGLSQLFTDLGCARVVSGGQTMNPSTDDILRAIESVPAQTVFVLPNNKNIIMAAEQTIALADRHVVVLPTRSIPQGLSAMLVFDPDISVKENQMGMIKAAEHVATGQITFAARDSEFDGHKIKQGEVLALDNGKLSFVSSDVAPAVQRLTKSLVKRDSTFITLIYGEGITEEDADKTADALRAKLSDSIEVHVINGGQPVYYYIISVE
ncbi:MAG: DAK2 domain-containing protein [Acetanaerobacterium sp.]